MAGDDAVRVLDGQGRPILLEGEDAKVATGAGYTDIGRAAAADIEVKAGEKAMAESGLGQAAEFFHAANKEASLGFSDYRDKLLTEFLYDKKTADRNQHTKDLIEEHNPWTSRAGQAAVIIPSLFLGGELSALTKAGVGAARGAAIAGAVEGSEILGANVAKGALGKALAEGGGSVIGMAGSLAEQKALSVLGSSALGEVGSLAVRGSAEGALYGLSTQTASNLVHDKPITSELWSATAGGALLGGLGGAAAGGIGLGAKKALAMASGRLEAKAAGMLGVDEFVSKTVASEVKAGGNAAVARSNVVRGLTDIVEGKISATAEEALHMASQARDTSGKLIGNIAKEFEREAPKVSPSVSVLLDKIGKIKNEYASTSFGATIAADLSSVEKKIASWENKPISTWVQESTNVRQLMKEATVKGSAVSETLQKSIAQRVMGSIDSTIEEAMLSAEKLSPSLEGKAAQFKAAKVQYGLAAELAKASEARIREGGVKAAKSAFSPMEAMGVIGSVISGHGALGAAYAAAKKVAVAAASPKVTEALYRMSSAARMAEATGQVSSGIRSGLQKFFSGASRVGSTELRKGREKTTRDSYQKALDESLELSSQLHSEKVREYASTLAKTSPVVAENIVSQYDRAKAFLSTARPPSETSLSLVRQPKLAGLSQAEMEYMNKDRAVKNPMSVLEMLQDGTVTKESVDAIKEVYPNMYKQMVEVTMSFVQEHMAKGKTIPFQKVVGLGILLGQPLIPIMEPGVMADIQASMVPTQQPGRPKSADADANSQARSDSTLTDSEKVEQKT